MKTIVFARGLVVAACGIAEAAGTYIAIGTPLDGYQFSRSKIHAANVKSPGFSWTATCSA